MSRFKATPIDTPAIEELVPYRLAVTYNRTAKTVGGIDLALQTEGGAIACANDGAKDCWFRCQSIQAAGEVLETYHKGEYISLKWYTKKT